MAETSTTGIKWDVVKAEMESSDWEDNEASGGDGQTRRVFLGTVFSLFPSGKFYLPFACSNLDPCEQCQGRGGFPPHRKRRIAKKWQAKGSGSRFHDRVRRERFVGNVPALQKRGWYRSYRNYWRRGRLRSCVRCGGLGSREAYLDELYREQLEAEADERGYGIENGDGDPCDVFATEYRDKPDEEEDEEEDDDDDGE